MCIRQTESSQKKIYPDANEISELGVGVDVHLDDTVANSSGDLLC